MTNSTKMTLEERIVQTLKDDSLMKLVGDEDAITELVTRAIREALFQPIRVPRSYGGGYDEKPSLVVQAAKDVADKFAQKTCDILFDELVADPEKKKLVYATIVDMLPNHINTYMDNTLRNMLERSSYDAINKLRDMLKSDPQYLTR